MKTKTYKAKGEPRMKTTADQTPASLEAPDSSVHANLWEETRFAQLADLAHDGDEIAKAELEMIFEGFLTT